MTFGLIELAPVPSGSVEILSCADAGNGTVPPSAPARARAQARIGRVWAVFMVFSSGRRGRSYFNMACTKLRVLRGPRMRTVTR
jgi:hypothetical protein